MTENEPPGDIPTLDEVKMAHFRRVYRLMGGDKVRTAEALGIALKTVYNLLARCEEETAVREVR